MTFDYIGFLQAENWQEHVGISCHALHIHQRNKVLRGVAGEEDEGIPVKEGRSQPAEGIRQKK